MRRTATFAVTFLVLTFAATALSGVIPPNSRGFGQSLGDWQRIYWTSTLTGGSDTEGNVLLMPLPAGEFNPDTGNVEGELSIAIGPGTAFFLPMFVFIGESYVQPVPDDDPADFEFLFLDNPDLAAVIRLDGSPVIDSATDDLTAFYAGPEFFDPPITDGYPINRDVDLDAAAAIWVEGLGFGHPPLPPGEHTLHLLLDTGLGFGFDNTWHITVEP